MWNKVLLTMLIVVIHSIKSHLVFTLYKETQIQETRDDEIWIMLN